MIKILSYGGGLDSFAMLVDAIQRGDLPDHAVFADTGSPDTHDGEWPGTYKHIREVAMPLFKKHGIPFTWITSEMYPIRRGYNSLIDFIKDNGMMLTRISRVCTSAAKVERINKWIRDTFVEPDSIEVWIGFEAGEENRKERDPHNAKTCGSGLVDLTRRNRFPLIEGGFCRCRCEILVREAGYPVPRKSACMYCPYNSKGDWKTLAKEQPVTFNKAVKLENSFTFTKKNEVKLTFSGKEEISLRAFTAKSYQRKKLECKTCGRELRASKVVGTGWLTPEEYVSE